MRLIDLDACLDEAYVESIYADDSKVAREMTNFFRYQPTVDAIPKQWLRELQTRYLKEDCLMSVGIVNDIMNLWDYEKDKWEKEVSE